MSVFLYTLLALYVVLIVVGAVGLTGYFSFHAVAYLYQRLHGALTTTLRWTK